MSRGVASNAGLYTPLPMPSAPWRQVSMDFMLGLPRMHRGMDSMMVAMDRFSKMVYFVPYGKTMDTSHILALHFKVIICLHGVPSTITSDHDTKFMGHF